LVDIVATATIPLTAYCAIEADFLVRLLLGEQWLGAIPVFRVLAVAGALQSATSTAGLVQLSFGDGSRFFKWGVVGAFVFVGSFIVGLPFGIRGVAISYTCANLLITVPTLIYCYHGTPVTISLFLKAVATPLLIGSVATAAAFVTKAVVAGGLLLNHLVILSVFILAYFGTSACRASIRESVHLIPSAGANRYGFRHDRA